MLMVCSLQCINREARAANFSSSLSLPDKTLQFVKDHPLMDDSVTPIDNRPRLIKRGVNYTQIVVDRTQALDRTVYDVMFISTGGSWALVATCVIEISPRCPEEFVFERSSHLGGFRSLGLSDHLDHWLDCKSWPRSGNSGWVGLGCTRGARGELQTAPPFCLS